MEVVLNGGLIQLPENVVYIADVLKYYDIQDKIVIVEVNGVIIPKLEHQNTRVSDKDQIEIVHFVGGG
jgi:sulfur carrier protein